MNPHFVCAIHNKYVALIDSQRYFLVMRCGFWASCICDLRPYFEAGRWSIQ